jgi:hypothetical protein
MLTAMRRASSRVGRAMLLRRLGYPRMGCQAALVQTNLMLLKYPEAAKDKPQMAITDTNEAAVVGTAHDEALEKQGKPPKVEETPAGSPEQAREKHGSFALEADRRWFFNHPDKTIRYTGWLQFYTAALFVATVLNVWVLHSTDQKIEGQARSTHDLAVAASQQAVAAGNQVTAMQGQLAVMQAQQRAWVTFENHDDRKIRLTTGITYNENGGAVFSIYFPIKNTGHAPARAVWVNALALPMGLPDLKDQQLKFINEQRTGGPSLGAGRYLFPGDDGEFLITLNIGKDEIAKSSKLLSPNVTACVVYAFMDEATAHLTCITMEMFSLKGVIFGNDTPVPLSEIVLRYASVFGVSYAN